MHPIFLYNFILFITHLPICMTHDVARNGKPQDKTWSEDTYDDDLYDLIYQDDSAMPSTSKPSYKEPGDRTKLNNNHFKQSINIASMPPPNVDPLSPTPFIHMTGPPIKLIIEKTDTTNKNVTLNSKNKKKISCIYCHNVELPDCKNPGVKILPSIGCSNKNDVCYSQFTPFGVVDRGCFNRQKNISTYVCTCNLCNHISMADMPFMFSSEKDWVDNVNEMTRSQHLRRTVLKDMECLRCEVNLKKRATRSGLRDEKNCLEGIIGSLPTEVCEEDSVCGVRANRSAGYIWRGCLQSPVYNYWWSLCKGNYCNNDSLSSVYEVEFSKYINAVT